MQPLSGRFVAVLIMAVDRLILLECAGRAKRPDESGFRSPGTFDKAGGRPSQSGVALRLPCSLHLSFAPRAKKPRRGGLSIEEPGDHPPSFCFSAARVPGYLLNSPPAAPLKNKKKGAVVGGAAAINRPPLTGFEPTHSCRGSRPGMGPEGSQIIRPRSSRLPPHSERFATSTLCPNRVFDKGPDKDFDKGPESQLFGR